MEFKAENFEVTVDNKIIYIVSLVIVIVAIGNVIKAVS